MTDKENLSDDGIRHRLLHGVRVSEVQAEVDELWDELKSDPSIVQLFPSSERANLKRGVLVEATKEDIGAIETAILVKFVIPVAATVAIDLWKTVFLPRIREKFGEDSIDDPKQ